MKTEVIEQEISLNGNRKINIGVRGYPELKNILSKEAVVLGITISEHVENILLNKDVLLKEINNLKEETQALKEEVSKLRHLAIDLGNRLKGEIENGKNINTENEKINIEHHNLKSKMILKDEQVVLYSDKRLLGLFAQVKGLTVTIQTYEGPKKVTYDDPKDLLLAMIYSFKLKES
ncbi:MAG: hypothetical protein V4511_01070 [Bacteroidota bacterium]